MAEQDESLRTKQPWQAAYDKDYAWLGGAINKHYHGDDSDLQVLMGGLLQAFAGQNVEHYSSAADAFLRGGKHPTLGRAFSQCGYTPMIELLRYLEANGFTSYIASGGDRDFMRPITEEIYGIPSERVIGSSNALGYTEDEHGGRLATRARGLLRRRAGQADPHLEPHRPASDPRRRATRTATSRCFGTPAARTGPALRLLVLHDDAEREFDYTAGAEQSLERRGEHGWTVVSIKNDWSNVFA